MSDAIILPSPTSELARRYHGGERRGGLPGCKTIKAKRGTTVDGVHFEKGTTIVLYVGRHHGNGELAWLVFATRKTIAECRDMGLL